MYYKKYEGFTDIYKMKEFYLQGGDNFLVSQIKFVFSQEEDLSICNIL